MNTNLRSFWCAFPFLLLCSCGVHEKLASFDFKDAVKKYEAGDVAGASNGFSSAIAQNASFSEAYFFRGVIRLSGSNYVLAIQDFDKVIALDSHNATAYADRGIANLVLRDFPAALTNFSEAIKWNPNETGAYKYRGVVRVTMRDWDGALDDFNQAQKLDADDPEIYRNRAGLEVMRKEFESTVADATRAIELKDSDPVSYRIRGIGRMRLKDYDAAMVDLNKAIQLMPRDAEAIAGRGLIEVLKGDFKAAEADLTRATELNPTNLTAMVTLVIAKKKSGDFPGALAVLSKVAEQSPKTPEIWQGLGYLQNDMVQYAPALQSCRKAIELDPRMYYSHFRVWLIRARLGERDEATTELRAGMKAREEDEGREWELCIGRFLTGDLAESDFLAQATESAVRPSDLPGQKCESLYYAGMKRLLDGDKAAAADFFEKCIASGQDNFAEYFSAKAELQELKKH